MFTVEKITIFFNEVKYVFFCFRLKIFMWCYIIDLKTSSDAMCNTISVLKGVE